MRKKLGKKDYIFIAVLLAVCLAGLCFFYIFFHQNGGQVVVTRDGETYGTYSLSKDQTISIKDGNGNVTNTLVIRNQKAYMESADCPDKLCVRQKSISLVHETIVCLPNKVVVTVENKEASEIDGMVQ